MASGFSAGVLLTNVLESYAATLQHMGLPASMTFAAIAVPVLTGSVVALLGNPSLWLKGLAIFALSVIGVIYHAPLGGASVSHWVLVFATVALISGPLTAGLYLRSVSGAASATES